MYACVGACFSVGSQHTYSTYKGQKRASELPELVLQMVVTSLR